MPLMHTDVEQNTTVDLASGSPVPQSPWSSLSWPAVIGTVLSLVGLAVSAYLTYEHYSGSKSLTCPAEGGIVNCLKVTTSAYSRVAGVPVADLGLAFFVLMLWLQLPPIWASSSPAIRWGRLAWSVIGVGTACYLVYAELFRLDAICLWCTSVHVVSLLLFITTAFGTALVEPES